VSVYHAYIGEYEIDIYFCKNSMMV